MAKVTKMEILEAVWMTRDIIRGDLLEVLDRKRTEVMDERDQALAVNQELAEELEILRPLVRQHSNEIVALREDLKIAEDGLADMGALLNAHRALLADMDRAKGGFASTVFDSGRLEYDEVMHAIGKFLGAFEAAYAFSGLPYYTHSEEVEPR